MSLSTEGDESQEVEVNPTLVARLVATQFPAFGELPIAPLQSSGTDNAIFRLGQEFSLRFPRIGRASTQLEKEILWLPKLASKLPQPTPVPVERGRPGNGYPWTWSINRWLKGNNARHSPPDDERQAALDLAEFIKALRRIDPSGGPRPGLHNFGRGAPLRSRDVEVGQAIESIVDIPKGPVVAAWEAAIRAPEWEGPAMWIHGDLSPGNLLVLDGRLGGVIDFGGLAIGDPACDLSVAWNFLSSQTRPFFREAIQADDAAWTRGRGWALSIALIALPYYAATNRTIADESRRTIAEVISES